MPSIMIDYSKHDLTREELEKELKILADQIAGTLSMLSRMGGVSDELYISLRNRLQEKNLLPKEPPGTSFWRYVGQLEKPLRAGDKEARDFVKRMEGVVGAVLTVV